MSRITALVVGVAAVLASAEAAATVSLTNRDDRTYKVTIVENGTSQDHSLAPSAVLEGICPHGCIIRLNDSEDDEYKLEGDEIVSIEDGFVYYDGSEPPEQPVPGEGGDAHEK
ncbi:MAG TPA: hypothetical protein VF226_12590 [Hyphomicrobiaceae bacterium]